MAFPIAPTLGDLHYLDLRAIYGAQTLSQKQKKAEYAGRNKAFLDAVEAGAIILRGDFDDIDTVMARLMSRVSTVNALVRDNYIGELKRVGL